MVSRDLHVILFFICGYVMTRAAAFGSRVPDVVKLC